MTQHAHDARSRRTSSLLATRALERVLLREARGTQASDADFARLLTRKSAESDAAT